MSQHLRLWYNQEEGYYAVDTAPDRKVHHITDGRRIARLLERLWLSRQYEFRPFLGTRVGIVATKKGV